MRYRILEKVKKVETVYMYINYSAKVWCLASLVLLSTLLSAHAANDLLLMPAVKTDNPAASILLDVVNTGEQLVAVGEHGLILLSTDQGESWVQSSVPTSVTLTAVYFPTAQHGWAVGHDGVVLHSSDGGKSWEKQLDGTTINGLLLAQVEQFIVHKQNEVNSAGDDQLEDLEYELENLQYFLNDSKMAVEEGPVRPLIDLWFKNEREGIVVGTFGMILRTTDGGENWLPILDRIDNPDGFHYYGIARSGDSLFIAGEVGTLFRSDDDGQHWERLESPYEGSYFGVVGSLNGDLLAIFGLRGNAFVSSDGGQNWTTANTPKGTSFGGGLIRSDGSLWLIGNDGTLARSEDGGADFSISPDPIAGGVSIAEAGDDQLVLVGLKGVSRIVVNKLGQ